MTNPHLAPKHFPSTSEFRYFVRRWIAIGLVMFGVWAVMDACSDATGIELRCVDTEQNC